jgi:polysaccharide biosynthesis/export protein
MPTFQQLKREVLDNMRRMKSPNALRNWPKKVSSMIFRMVFLAISFGFAMQQALAQSVPDYLLGGGDTVKIIVFLSPELSTEARISEQGLINFPLIGIVKIGGLSTSQAEILISEKLKQGSFIQKAQVLMSIAVYRSQLVSVLGNIVKPGRYPLEVPGTRLTELLATAGGISSGGSDTVLVTRQNADGSLQKVEVDLPSIYLDGQTKLDIVLQAGDSLYVHRQPNFYIAGAVGKPGIYNVDRGLTVGQAIAKGGSYTLRSRESGVRLIRRNSAGRMVESTPKMDEPILPEDQIFVRESLF